MNIVKRNIEYILSLVNVPFEFSETGVSNSYIVKFNTDEDTDKAHLALTYKLKNEFIKSTKSIMIFEDRNE